MAVSGLILIKNGSGLFCMHSIRFKLPCKLPSSYVALLCLTIFFWCMQNLLAECGPSSANLIGKIVYIQKIIYKIYYSQERYSHQTEKFDIT